MVMQMSSPVSEQMLAAFAIMLVVGSFDIAYAQNAWRSGEYESRKHEVNDNVVTIIGSGTVSPYTRMAEDIQNVLDEPKTPGGLRILPVLGRGGAHNAQDVLLLKGVDMGVLEQDDLRNAKKDDPKIFASVEQRIHYITKLANSEFQIIARGDVRSLKDLEGKKVNFLKKMSSTHIACETIFNALQIKVEPVFLDQDEASAKLRSGEIAAFARYAPAPHGAFSGFRAEDGFHFLPVDPEQIPPDAFAKLLQTYSPAILKNESYPLAIPADRPVPTLAGSLILVTYAWPVGSERYRRLSRFVGKLFDNIDQFKNRSRHPKWQEINLAYEVPGWTRFKPAQDWLNRHKKQVPASQ